MNFRRMIFAVMTDEIYHPLTKVVNRFLAVSIVAAILVCIMQTEPTVVAEYGPTLVMMNAVFGTLFLVEYTIRVWVAGESAKYQGLSGRLKYIASPLALIDLIALVPYFVSVFPDAFIFRAIRLLRITNLAKLGAYSSALHRIMAKIWEKRYELIAATAVAIMAMLIAATGIYFFERYAQPDTFGSIPRSIWWAMATLTTIGYGDVYPITVGGRVFATVFALSTIGLVGVPTGIMATAFMQAYAFDDGHYPTQHDYQEFERGFIAGRDVGVGTPNPFPDNDVLISAHGGFEHAQDIARKALDTSLVDGV